ncbi:MAG: disulfide bond formation protein B [Gammaproteobacteria bacterium]|nr:disulfide bond formation protein B [Gammaproteobacteria bacterium]
MHILHRLQKLPYSRIYWLAYIVIGLSMLTVALFYQYQLEELPCVVCIQIRLWFSVLVIVGILGYLLRKHSLLNMITQLGIVISAIGLVERSYLLLGTERGFIFSDCGFNAGLPQWFAIEQWLPWLYQVEASCGYTPEILFGVTMAEALMLLSICMLLVCVTIVSVTLASIFKN